MVISNLHWRNTIEANQEDNEVTAFRAKVEAGTTSKYVIQEGLLYYLSGRREEVKPRLVVSDILRIEIMKKCHERMGHMRVDKTYELIVMNYYGPDYIIKL